MLPTISKRIALPSLVDEFFRNDFFGDISGWNRNHQVPSVNIAESKQGYTIELATPGLSKDDFQINLDGHVLSISSRKEENNEEKNDKYIRREFSFSTFSRSFTLPDDVNEDKINAKQKDGILVIEIPKKDESISKVSKAIKIN